MTFVNEPHTPAVAELGILRQVFSHDNIQQGVEELAHGLGVFFQSHVNLSRGVDDPQYGNIPTGAQTEWLNVAGESVGFVFVRDIPLSPAQRQHARLIIDMAGFWFDAVSEVHRLHHELEQSAHQDALTRLPNSRNFSEALRNAVVRAQRNEHLIALLHIDLIGFKKINDELGDEIGDELLFALSERMKLSLHDNDLVARVGPDEFAVLLYNIGHPDNIAQIVERFENVLADAPIPTNLWKGARIGIGIYPLDGETHSDLLASAEKAVLSIKQSTEAAHAYYSELPEDFR
jgi:diguanylate cyclase (GGDEF)-like protein